MFMLNIFLTSIGLLEIHGRAVVEISFVKFTEVHYSYGAGDYCCESWSRDQCSNSVDPITDCCPQHCQHYFKLCVLDLDDPNGSCLQELETSVLTPNQTLTTLNPNTDNPWTFEYAKAFSGIYFKLEIHDRNFASTKKLNSEIESRIFIQPGLNKQVANETTKDFKTSKDSGDYMFTFRAYCAEHYFNKSCEVFCQAQNTSSVRYTCNPVTGAKQCYAGWIGEKCDQDIRLPIFTFEGNAVIQNGEDVTAKCQLLDTSLQIYNLWYRNGVQVGNTTATLFTFRNVSFADSGNYSCQTFATFGATVSNKLKLEVWGITQPNTEPKMSKHVAKNGNLTLTCTSNVDRKNPDYKWTDDSGKIISNNSVAHITGLKLSDNGTSFTCHVKLMNVTSQSGPVTVFVLENLIPVISSPLKNFVLLGSETTLQCMPASSSITNATYSWLNESNHVISNQRTYTISGDNIQKTRTVKCQTIIDDVVYTSQPIKIMVSWLTQPTISITKSNNSITISCKSDGIPKPKYKWFHDGSTIHNVNGSHLYLPFVTQQNVGKYQCASMNGLNMKSSAVHTLTPINYCNEKRCHQKASCQNVGNNFECACLAGYQGDGYKCEPVKEDLEDERDSFRTTAIILAVLLAIVVLILLILLLKWCCTKQKASSQSKYDTQINSPTNFDNKAYSSFDSNEMKDKTTKPNA